MKGTILLLLVSLGMSSAGSIVGWSIQRTFADNNCANSVEASVKYWSLNTCDPNPDGHGYTKRAVSSSAASAGFASLQQWNNTDAQCTILSRTTHPNPSETTQSDVCSYIMNDNFGTGHSRNSALLDQPVFPKAAFIGVGFATFGSKTCDPLEAYEYQLINPVDQNGSPNCISIPSLVQLYSYKVSCASVGAVPKVIKFTNGQCSGTGTASGVWDLSMSLFGGGPQCTYSPRYRASLKFLSCVSSIGVGPTINATSAPSPPSPPVGGAARGAAAPSPANAAAPNAAVVAVCVTILLLITLVVVVQRRVHFARQASLANAVGAGAAKPNLRADTESQVTFGDVIPSKEKKPAPAAAHKAEWQSASL